MNQTYKKKLGVFAMMVFGCMLSTSEIFGQAPLVAYNFVGAAGSEDSLAADAQPANAIFYKAKRGSAIVKTAGTNYLTSDNWPTPFNANAYVSFAGRPNTGFNLNLTSVALTLRHSATGPATFEIRSSLDNFTAVLKTITIPSATTSDVRDSLLLPAAFTGLGSKVEFRIFGYGATATTGTGRVTKTRFYGTVTPVSTGPVPTLNFASATSTVAENVTGGTLNIPVTITNPSATAATTVTVAVATTPGTATSGTDYTITTGTLTFPAAGTTNQDAVLTITNDAIFEGAETIQLVLLNPSTGAVIGTAGTHTVTITDNETAPTISFGTPTAVTVGENAGAVNIPVVLSGASSAAITVEVALATAPGTATSGSDFTFTSPATVTIPAGATTANATVSIIDDAAVESTETIALILQNAGTGAALGTTNQGYTVSITDNDVATANPVLSFQAPTSTVAENAGTVTIPVTIASPSATNPTSVTVVVSATPGTATAGTDYTLGTTTVTFPAGSAANQNVSVTITDDNIFEGNETLNITLQNPTNSATIGATNTHTLTITDNDVAPVVAFGSPVAVTVQENAGTVNVPVTISNPSTSPVTVQVALATPAGTASATTDFTFATQTLTFPANSTTTQNATVTITNDKLIEANETILLTLQTPTGGTIGTANAYTITIVSDDVIPTYTVAQITTNNTTTFLPDSLGKKVKVVGTLYGVNQRTTTQGGIQLTLIDNTGGIGIFASTNTVLPTTIPVEGDVIRAIGTVGHFNGLTQITLDSIKVISTGAALKQPALVTGPLTEAHESELIKIANPLTLVTPSQWPAAPTAAFNVDLTDGTNTYQMRIVPTSDIYNTPAPTLPFFLTGIGSQFDSSDPRDSGYQIIPRRLTDIQLVSGISEELSSAVSIYPNPVSHTLNLNLQALASKKATVSVVNALGQVVANVPANATELSVASFPAGVYTLRIATSDAMVTKRFVKIN